MIREMIGESKVVPLVEAIVIASWFMKWIIIILAVCMCAHCVHIELMHAYVANGEKKERGRGERVNFTSS